MPRIAYVNGRYLPHANAAVHVEDRGYQFGDGVYEVCEIARGFIIDMTGRLDRLGRSLGHLIKMIGTLEKRSVHFRSLTETIDTSSSGGRLVFHLMGAMAEFEHALISERTKAGMKVAKKQGQPIGRPPLLSEGQREEIRRCLAGGTLPRKLAERYGVSRATIARVNAQCCSRSVKGGRNRTQCEYPIDRQDLAARGHRAARQRARGSS